MKVYILKDEDFELLRAELSHDPQHGETGGSSSVLSQEEKKAYLDAHRFYKYLIERWLDKVRSS